MMRIPQPRECHAGQTKRRLGQALVAPAMSRVAAVLVLEGVSSALEGGEGEHHRSGLAVTLHGPERLEGFIDAPDGASEDCRDSDPHCTRQEDEAGGSLHLVELVHGPVDGTQHSKDGKKADTEAALGVGDGVPRVSHAEVRHEREEGHASEGLAARHPDHSGGDGAQQRDRRPDDRECDPRGRPARALRVLWRGRATLACPVGAPVVQA
mmetsp:Transcript_50/g.190  ORF Transcript_50/g.190 Transcript_50/m.190 type:complete len:210 (-) Transcript_50:377-1006(-)